MRQIESLTWERGGFPQRLGPAVTDMFSRFVSNRYMVRREQKCFWSYSDFPTCGAVVTELESRARRCREASRG
jgi:hypothetical protein